MGEDVHLGPVRLRWAMPLCARYSVAAARSQAELVSLSVGPMEAARLEGAQHVRATGVKLLEGDPQTLGDHVWRDAVQQHSEDRLIPWCKPAPHCVRDRR